MSKICFIVLVLQWIGQYTAESTASNEDLAAPSLRIQN